jgi:serine/threonine protein kinase
MKEAGGRRQDLPLSPASCLLLPASFIPQNHAMQELRLENSLVDGRYEVRERLGRGSYAEIFVARDREAGWMEVVIKALNTSLQGTPDADLERTLVENFQNEAIALDTVRHPHVILRWGHGTAADLRGLPFHYLVLEFMPGGDLLKLCRNRSNHSLSLDQALFYFKQACEGLAFAHSKGIIHRDLKPNNFLLSEDHLTLKIADFGVAKITTEEDSEITRVGADIYAPPEHSPVEQSGHRLTASADIYSLAKSFYTVVCGRAPSQFRCDPITVLPHNLMREPWGRRLLDVLRRATDDDPIERYHNVVDFWNDLMSVAAIAEDESVDEETLVKPRLRVNPGALPEKPVLPEFNPALASSQTTVSSAMPVKTKREQESVAGSQENLKPSDRINGRAAKIYVELQPPQPATPGIKTELRPVATATDAAVKEQPPPQVERVVGTFTEKIRRRLFLTLVMLALFGLIMSVYSFVRGGSQGMAFGFGQPTKIEITTENLNVRNGPGGAYERIGVISQGSRHKVIQQLDKNWMEIEISQWTEIVSDSANENRGWVYSNLDGNPANVRVVSRKLW